MLIKVTILCRSCMTRAQGPAKMMKTDVRINSQPTFPVTNIILRIRSEVVPGHFWYFSYTIWESIMAVLKELYNHSILPIRRHHVRFSPNHLYLFPLECFQFFVYCWVICDLLFFKTNVVRNFCVAISVLYCFCLRFE